MAAVRRCVAVIFHLLLGDRLRKSEPLAGSMVLLLPEPSQSTVRQRGLRLSFCCFSCIGLHRKLLCFSTAQRAVIDVAQCYRSSTSSRQSSTEIILWLQGHRHNKRSKLNVSCRCEPNVVQEPGIRATCVIPLHATQPPLMIVSQRSGHIFCVS